jgi:hypothetical protein
MGAQLGWGVLLDSVTRAVLADCKVPLLVRAQ